MFSRAPVQVIQKCFCPVYKGTYSVAASLRELLGPDSVVTDPEVLLKHNTDWTGQFKGHSRVLVKPKNTEDVSRLLRHCSANRQATTCSSLGCQGWRVQALKAPPVLDH
jgi:hypothetical protein